jgi:thioredoxin-like negative regulator of GroEL
VTISQEQHLLGFVAFSFAFMPSSKSPNLVSTSNREVEASHRRAEDFYLKLLLGGLIGIILLTALFWGGHDAYVRWEERRLIRQAVFALQHGDERTAGLAARNVLELKPSSAPAARIMADLAEREGNLIALEWRRQVVQLEPHSTEDVLAWARCALQFNDIGTAERALSGINQSGRQIAGYHAVAALIAQARQQDEKAENEWTEAIRLAPNDKAYQLQLAILQANAADEGRKAAGEATLKAFRDDPKQRAPATRALIGEKVAHRANGQELLALARDLQSYPEATLNDRLIFLDFLHQLQDPEFASYLTGLEKSVTDKPAELTTLLSWMGQTNLNLLALNFVKSFTPELVQKWPVALAVAEIYVRLGDWRGLENVTKTANWREFDCLRHAYLARALRAQDKPAAAEHEWAAAVKGASGQSELVLALVRVASEWKWESETVELLWTLAKYPEKQKDALQTLYRLYAKLGDTQGLFRVLGRLSESDPSNLNLENNLAQVSLLLNANQDEARRMAADVYHKMPSNPAYATTYAYSLLTKGDPKGAVKVLNALGEGQLRDPVAATYYGICLAATWDERARPFLETGRKTNLLPEEKALVEKALANLNSR